MRPPRAPPRRPRQRPVAEPGPGQKRSTMELVPRSPGRAAWPLTCLVLLSLRGCPGAGAQEKVQGFKLEQPQDKVVVTAGEMINLTCTVSGDKPVIGPVKWLKGWGSGNETVYADKGSFPRATRAEKGSSTDFSISISSAQPEDSGTYYCVKFRRSVRDDVDEVFQHGKGTEVSVHARPTHPVVSGPDQRAKPGQSVTFTCTAGGFFPKDIRVKWLKDKAETPAEQTEISPAQTNSSYSMSSTVKVTLQKDDVRSRLICDVRHTTLRDPLRAEYQLSQVLRVSPSIHVSSEPPGAVEVNKTVTITCHVKGFYPGHVNITWLENGTEVKAVNTSQPEELPSGFFELKSLVEVRATAEKNGAVITCRVVHDGQSPIDGQTTLQIIAPANEGQRGSSDPGNRLIYIVVGIVCSVLVLLVSAILYLIQAKQSKGKSSPSARLHEPEKSSEATTQESDPNNLTYADLNFDRERKTIRRMELNQQSEYACIQSSRPPPSDDNLTYADLDMVHLSKAPKRPAPHPEETGSEYASVQISKK
ncbi:tyrosine-protein phosphatase non-receptor type substrate 1 isoform 2-T2 [Porphyrio hochstetteri]